MPVHIYGKPGYFDDLTTEELGYTREIGHEAGLEVGTVLLGAGAAPAAMLLELPPNYTLERHAHDCHRVEVVVRGSVRLPDGRTLGPGDVLTSGPGELYGPHTAGPDGLLTVEIFSTSAGFAPIPSEEDGVSSEMLRDIRAKTQAAQAGE